MASNSSMHQFDQSYFLQELKKSNVIKNDDQNTLAKIKFITTGLVLAAKSVGLFNDQEILKWIRRGKKITQEQQATWVKMGRDLSLLFLEQFEKYKELSIYLKNELSLEEVEEWKSILNAQEYLWPAGKGKGWENIFNPVPSLCEKVSKEKTKQNADLNKRKLEEEDDENSKRQKIQLVSEGKSQVDDSSSIPENDSSNEKEDEKGDTEKNSSDLQFQAEGTSQMDDSKLIPENDSSNKKVDEKRETKKSFSESQFESECTGQMDDSSSIPEKDSNDEEEDEKRGTENQSSDLKLVSRDASEMNNSKSIPENDSSNTKEDEKRETEKSSSDLQIVSEGKSQMVDIRSMQEHDSSDEEDEKKETEKSSSNLQFVSEGTSQMDDSRSTSERGSSDMEDDEERMTENSSSDLQLISEGTSQLDDSKSVQGRNSSNEKEDSSCDESVNIEPKHKYTEKPSDSEVKAVDMEIKSSESEIKMFIKTGKSTVKAVEIKDINDEEIVEGAKEKYSTSKISDLIEIEKDEKEAEGMNIEYSKSVSMELESESKAFIDTDISSKGSPKVISSLHTENIDQIESFTATDVSEDKNEPSERSKKFNLGESLKSKLKMATSNLKLAKNKALPMLTSADEELYKTDAIDTELSVCNEKEIKKDLVLSTVSEGNASTDKRKLDQTIAQDSGERLPKASRKTNMLDNKEKSESLTSKGKQNMPDEKVNIQTSTSLETDINKKAISEIYAENTANIRQEKSKLKEDESKKLCVDLNFSKEFHLAVLEKAGAIDSNGNLQKISTYSVGLVLAAKSLGKYGDQDIMKWIRKGKKVNATLAQEWKIMGKALTKIFVEQFKKYGEMSHYLMNNVEFEDIKTWQKILAENEYIWPVGQNNGWLNVFREIPNLCSKMDTLLDNTDMSKQKSMSTETIPIKVTSEVHTLRKDEKETSNLEEIERKLKEKDNDCKGQQLKSENPTSRLDSTTVEVKIEKDNKGSDEYVNISENDTSSNKKECDEKINLLNSPNGSKSTLNDCNQEKIENPITISKKISNDYFVKQLKEANAINTESEDIDGERVLLKVTNITVGLVMAAIATGWYSDVDIIKWIRRGRKLNSQIEEQFKMFKKLSMYLVSNVVQQEQEWKKILEETKYVWPSNENDTWTNMFGYIPTISKHISMDSLMNKETSEYKLKFLDISCDTSKKVISPDQEPTKTNDIVAEKSERLTSKHGNQNLPDEIVQETNDLPSISRNEKLETEEKSELKEIDFGNITVQTRFSKEYHQALLEKAGAIDSNGNLLKISEYSVGLVLAAKSLGTIGDQEIMKWIRKGKKVDATLAQEWKKLGKTMTKIFVEQFKKFSEMSHYLMNNVQVEDVKTWNKILCENEYIWPVGQNKGWLNVFKEIPDLCSKIDTSLCDTTNMSKLIAMDETSTTSCENIEVKENVLCKEREKEVKDCTTVSATKIESIRNKNSSVVEKTNIETSTKETSVVTEVQTAMEYEKEKDNLDESDSSKAAVSEDDFTIAYFLSKLENAGAIKDESSKDLVKVVNISIGLVLAAISTCSFTYIDIVKWIRKGRKLNDLLENQFKCYKRLSVYLIKCTAKVNVKEWEKLLDNSKYVWPVEGSSGWEIIFGEIPEICQTLDFDDLELMPENISNSSSNVVDEVEEKHQKKDLTKSSIDMSEGVTKMEVEDIKNVETVKCSDSEKIQSEILTSKDTIKFSKEYFMSMLEKVGAVQDLKETTSDENSLLKISNITIGHVVAAKAVGLFKDQDIMKWIKKGSKIDPNLSQKYKKMGKALPALFVEQFKKYKQLSSYLLHRAEEQDIDKWLELLDESFVWAQDINSEWKIVFDEVPELCKKVESEKGSILNIEAENVAKGDVKSNDKSSALDSGIENKTSKLNTGASEVTNIESKKTVVQKSSEEIKKNYSKTLSMDQSTEDKSKGTNKEDLDLTLKDASTCKSEKDSSLTNKGDVTKEGPPIKRIKTESECSESKGQEIECIKNTISEPISMSSGANEGVKFTTEYGPDYFMSILQKAGAVECISEENTNERTLLKVKDVTIMHVLAAKSLGLFKDQDIMKWIKKGSKIDQQLALKYKKMGKALPSLFVEQFKMYKQLSMYLMNRVEKEDEEKWIELLNKSFVWPEDIKAGWQNVFGEFTELTIKIDGHKVTSDTADAKREVSEIIESEIKDINTVANTSECKKMDLVKSDHSNKSKIEDVRSSNTTENKSLVKTSSSLNNEVGKVKDELKQSDVSSNKSLEGKEIADKDLTMGEYKVRVEKEGSTISEVKSSIIDKSYEKLSLNSTKSSETAPSDDANISTESKENEIIFSQKYSLLQLVKAGALKKMAILENCPKNLMKIPKITVGLVLAAKSTGFFNDQDLMKWIRKGRKIEPELAQKWKQMGSKLGNLFVEQFKKYKELSDYLMNRVDPLDIESWVQLLDSFMYVWPTEGEKGWSYVFGLQVPVLCNKIHSLKEKSVISEAIRSNTVTPITWPVDGDLDLSIKSVKDQKSEPEIINLDTDEKSVTEAIFDKEYFISQLQEANAIKSSNEKILLPVKKVTLGLIIAARSINMYSDQEIMKWVKKTKQVDKQLTQKWKTMGKVLSAIFIEQFKKLKILSEFLQNEVDPTDIAIWKNILNNEYIWPIGEGKGWGNVFSEIPVLCLKIDNAIRSKDEKSDVKELSSMNRSSIDELRAKESFKIPKVPAITKIDKDYFLSELIKTGALISSPTNKRILKMLPKLTVGLVLSANAIREFSDTDILNWIKTNETMSPLLEDQFSMYKQFALYLMKLNNTVEIQEWHNLLQRTEYVWPVGRSLSWVNIFGELSGPCKKIHVNKIYSIIDDTADVKSKNIGLKEKSLAKPKNLTRLNKSHFMNLLTNAGALKTEHVTMSFTKKTLITISTSKLTVGVVVGAFVIGQMQGQIKQWIKKCMFSYNIDKRPGVNQQMSLYSKLGSYLQHDVPLDHVEEWKELLTARYIPPSVDEYAWTNVFEKEPILCEDIDISAMISVQKLNKINNTITKSSTSNNVTSPNIVTAPNIVTPQAAHYSAPPTPYVEGKNQSTTVQAASYASNQHQAVPSQPASYYNTGYGNQAQAAVAQGQAAASYGAHGQTPGMHNMAVVGTQQNQAAAGAYGSNYYQYYGGMGQDRTNYGGQYMQGQGSMGPVAYNAQGQATMPGPYGAQEQSASYAQMYPGYGTQYMMPGGTGQLDTNASTANAPATTVADDENETKKKIFFYDFPKKLTDEHLKMIFNEIGEVEEFTRNQDARDFCSIKMKDVKRVYRMFRILNGFKTGASDITWKVNILHSKLFTKREKTFGSNKGVENKIREQIKSIIDPILGVYDLEDKTKMPVIPVVGKNLEPLQALDRTRNNRSRSRSPGKRKRRSKSRSPDKRRRSKSPKSRFPDKRRRSKSPKRRKSKSRSPKRKSSPDRGKKSRSPRRKRSRSPKRSRSTDKKLRSNSPSDLSHSEDKRSIEVLNLSISLCKSVLNPLLDRCGSRKMKRPTGLILPDTNCVTEFVFNTQWCASVVAKLINGFRFPDRHLKVKLKMDEDVQEVSKDREEFTWKRLEQSLSLNQDIFVGNVQAQILRKGVYDIFGYKTRPCLAADCSLDNRNCEDYHNVYEKRRDMRLFSYTDEECPYIKRGNCPEGEDCDKAHSNVERAYHMCRIHRVICPNDGSGDKCPRNYCISAHAETPEVLYSNSWRDVHTSGLGQTFEYLVGAIHNLRHIDTTREGVYILLITPSQFMCHWLSEAVRDLIKDYRQKIVIINDTMPTDGEKIIFGTPESVINLLRTGAVEVVGTLAAVILDDSSLLLSSYLQEMKTIAHNLTTGQRHSQIDLNRIVVSDQNYEDEVDTWSDLLNTEFIVLGSLSPGLSPEQIQSPLDMKNRGKKGDESMSSRYPTPNTSSVSQKERSTSRSVSQSFQKERSTSRSVSRTSILHEEKSHEAADGQSSSSRLRPSVTTNPRPSVTTNPRPSVTTNPASCRTINACNKLIALCDRMGFIGHSLKAIIGKAIEYDNDNDKVLKVFMEPDSIMVMDMAMSKLCKDASLATDPSSKEDLLQAFNQTKALIEYLKNPAAAADETKEKEPAKPNYGLNIEELATVTYNKDPTILFKLIKDYLNGVGVEPTDDKVKEVFNMVTTIHFKMGSQHIPDDTAPVNVAKPPSRSDIPPTVSEPQSSGKQMGLSELLTVGDDMEASYRAGEYDRSRDGYDTRMGPDRGPMSDLQSRGAGPSWDDYRYGQLDRGMPRSDDYRGAWDGGRQGPEWDRYGRVERDRSPGLDRRSAPEWNRSAASDYDRPAASDYDRPAASDYNRPDVPDYNRPDAPGLNSRYPRGPSSGSAEWDQPGDYRYTR